MSWPKGNPAQYVKGQKSANPSGRPKGVPAKATLAKQAAIAKTGITPLDWMLAIIRDPAQTNERRDAMAIAAAPYVHPKLAAITHEGDALMPAAIVVVERRIISPADGDARSVVTLRPERGRLPN